MEAFQWQPAPSPAAAAALVNQTTAEAMLTLQDTPSAQQAVLVKAGGVDLLDLMKEGLVNPRRLVDISRLAELQGIAREGDGSLRIGALTTLAQIAAHPGLRQSHAALAQAAAMAASPQIRNRATLGGNLLQRPRCWYLRSAAHHCLRKGGGHCFAFAGDNRYHAVFANHGCAIVHPSTPATALLALQGRVELLHPQGRRRQVPLEDFFVLPEADMHRENILAAGEILTAVRLPPQSPASRSVYFQVAEREAFDWPLAAVAVVLDLDAAGLCRQASIVLGAAAPAPWRARQAEALLTGATVNEETAMAAGEAALAGAAPLAQNAYKLPMLATLLRRAVLAAAAPQPRPQGS
ncbi:FAD binding domain-containing protein [Acidithiobacillus sp. M4-SHS-6]|uniref:FAD binding domain-containing protein n=1 Tax=Acidithiobacillus sp. M4-SHS-6 TaxID=3383024 RepID=UPI0039BEA1F8